MNISGIEILNESIVYAPTLPAVLCAIILFIGTLILIDLFTNGNKYAGLVGAFTAILCILCLIFSFDDSSPNILNHPNKIIYTIDIIDDNAWKELGPKCRTLRKIYENKEIYLIEMEYIE